MLLVASTVGTDRFAVRFGRRSRDHEESDMRIISKFAIATAFVVLAGCGGNNNANNAAEMNATDMNAGMTDLNATEMNAPTEMNATGNEMNATGNMATGNEAANTTNNSY
jgi:hypothetical protein